MRIEVPDRDTVLFKNVPLTAEGCFNKERTNLLCKKTGTSAAFLVFVDEDLTYHGRDAELHKAFTGGPTQSGWRVLMLGNIGQTDPQVAAERGLAALGFPDGSPRLRFENGSGGGRQEQGESSALDAFSVNLSEAVDADEHLEPTVGRVAETEAVVSCLLRWGQTRLPLLCGASGVGKSNLFYNAARLLRRVRPGIAFLRIDLADAFAGTLFEAEREKLLAAMLKEAGARDGDVVLALEHLECAVREVSHGLALLSEALYRGTRIAGTTLPRHRPRLRQAPLARRSQPILLADVSPAETGAILERLRGRIAAHHRLEISPTVASLCLRRAVRLPGHLPAKAIMLLDESASNASLLGTKAVSPDDVCAAYTRCRHAYDAEKAEEG